LEDIAALIDARKAEPKKRGRIRRKTNEYLEGFFRFTVAALLAWEGYFCLQAYYEFKREEFFIGLEGGPSLFGLLWPFVFWALIGLLAWFAAIWIASGFRNSN
jgi:hypothetical protein